MEDGTVSRRTIPGSERSASVIGISLDASSSSSSPGERATVAVLRRARGRGVTVFDAAGARRPELAERWIAAAFPEPDPDLRVVVGLASTSQPHGPPWPSPAAGAPDSTFRDRLRTSLEESRRRLAPHRPSLVEVSLDVGATIGLEAAELREEAVAQGLDGVLVAAGTEAGRAAPGIPGPGPELYSVEGSLLARAALERIASECHGRKAGIFVRDPFAGGRLDGQRFALGVGDRAPSSAPRDLRSLRQEFEPVLRLSFLTRNGQRTLLGASLRYLLDVPSVISVLVPVPSPERLEAVLSAERSRPLDRAEQDQLERRRP